MKSYANILKNKKETENAGLFFIEGEKFVGEIPDSWEIVSLICSESCMERHMKKETGSVFQKNPEVIKDSLFERLSDTKNPQGIMAVLRKKVFDADTALSEKNALAVYAEELNDPGNLGAIIRTAHACDACGVFLSEGSVDMYNPKALRASAGSFFHLPVIGGMNIETFAGIAKEKNMTVTAADAGGHEYPYEIDYIKSAAVIIGNEARGLSETAKKCADHLVKIPMPGGAESLNISAACAVLLYEAVRQRMKPANKYI